jgi:pimeloyl-ACP methyl ester carboxylesterase
MPGRSVKLSPKGISSDEAAVSGASILEGMPGTSASFRWHGERIHYRCMGFGPPLILIHSPDVGGSCVEWRHNIEALAAVYTVYAIDLPGYGLSDIHKGSYNAEMYIRFVADFIRVLSGPGTHAIGCVLGASYLVHAAARWPALLGKLALIAPAGISTHRPGGVLGSAFHALKLPGLSSAVFGNGTSRFAILEHLQEDVYADESLAGPHAVDTRYWVSHRPFAESVESSRVSGLQNIDIRHCMKKVRNPVMLVWGRHAIRPPLSDADAFKQVHPKAKLAVFEKSALAPYEEEWVRFNHTMLDFLAETD